jgi:hypothetical protein
MNTSPAHCGVDNLENDMDARNEQALLAGGPADGQVVTVYPGQQFVYAPRPTFGYSPRMAGSETRPAEYRLVRVDKPGLYSGLLGVVSNDPREPLEALEASVLATEAVAVRVKVSLDSSATPPPFAGVE